MPRGRVWNIAKQNSCQQNQNPKHSFVCAATVVYAIQIHDHPLPGAEENPGSPAVLLDGEILQNAVWRQSGAYHGRTESGEHGVG